MSNLKKIRRHLKSKKAVLHSFPPNVGQPGLASFDIPKTLHSALQFLHAGNSPAAERLLNKVRAVDPSQPDALNLLGIIAMQRAEFVKAEKFFNQAACINPTNFQYHNNLGVSIKNQGRLNEAISCFNKSIQLNPEYAEAYNNLGNTLNKLDSFPEAIIAFEKALTLNNQYYDAYLGLSNSYKESDRVKDMMACLHKAISLNQNNPRAYHALGCAYNVVGEFDEAIKAFGKVIELNPNYVEVYFDLSYSKKYQSLDDIEVARINALLGNSEISLDNKAFLYFALGKIHDDCKHYLEAFKYYQEGNQIRRERTQFDRAAHRRFVEESIQVFTSEFFAKKGGIGSLTDKPVFVVGMPRSGTTLVEQIVASHPNVHGAGEQPYLHKIKQKISLLIGGAYPKQIQEIDHKMALELATYYENSVFNVAPASVKYVIDKAPYNFLHLGLISLLFPNARVIHCCRDPLDTCISNYFQCFKQGNSHSYDLEDLGFYYIQYKKIMTHWQKVLPIKILEVHYEDIVTNEQIKIRELLDFLGLTWDTACLEFYKANRSVKTASLFQTRQPIHNKSIQRWKKYEQFIGPLQEILNNTR